LYARNLVPPTHFARPPPTFPNQENVEKKNFTFPEADVLLLLDLSAQLASEHVLLGVEADDFAALGHVVAQHVAVDPPLGTSPAQARRHARARGRVGARLASKNAELRGHLSDLADDPILMPGERETALSINVYCSSAIPTKQLVRLPAATSAPVVWFATLSSSCSAPATLTDTTH